MKKIISILISISLVLGITGVTIAMDSKTEQYEVIFQAKEIVNMEKLLERAKKGINESEHEILYDF